MYSMHATRVIYCIWQTASRTVNGVLRDFGGGLYAEYSSCELGIVLLEVTPIPASWLLMSDLMISDLE